MNNEFVNKFIDLISEVSEYKFDIPEKGINRLEYWKNHIKDYVELYYRLSDEKSRNTFMKLLKYEVGMSLSGKLVRDDFNFYPSVVWKRLCKEANNVKHVPNDYVLDRVETFVLEGYNYENICCAEENDVVFDCGAYTGNTALYFSNRVGKKGKVYAFEAMPETYEKLKKNIGLVGGDNVVPCNYAISDMEKKLQFTENATSASRQIEGVAGIEVPAISIDQFVAKNEIEHVDFIKMDIEGAELDALDGIKETCNRFAPKLAICVYHKISDFIDIPKKILTLNPSYKFYIKHNSNKFSETVLFAQVDRDSKKEEVLVGNEELEKAEKLFNVCINIHKNCQIERRGNLLNQYVNLLNNNCKYKFNPVYEKDNRWVILPVSSDKKLDYGFCFWQNTVRVFLQMDGDLASIGNKFAVNVLKGLQTKIDTTYEEGKRFQVYYSISDVTDIKFVSDVMRFMMEKTFPILLSKGLVPDKIRFNNDVF